MILLVKRQPVSVPTVSNSILLICSCYMIIANILPQISKYLLVERKYYIFPVTFFVYMFSLTVIVMFNIPSSRYLIILGALFSIIWFYFGSILRREHTKLKLVAIDNFDIKEFYGHKILELTPLSKPYNINNVGKGLVANLHGKLTTEQEKFISDCSLHNIPVFHITSIKEMVEGRVQVNHLSENSIGSLHPEPLYISFKQLWEILFVLITLPITLPIMVITAVLIKLESQGPIMFIQERIGQGGGVFKIYKFRSMSVRPKNANDKFATQELSRITKVGRIIRKTRIDELPQFINILKGEMALIGPRPEQESFVKKFEKEISFYGYRHMVKPGITGWAQTVQGYADDADSTRVKLSYDLYYIKNLSFWLDVNILFKTIRTIVTGFGAQ